MGFALSGSVVTQSGSLQSQVVTAVAAQDVSTGLINAAIAWTSVNQGHAFAIVRSGTVVAVRCIASVSGSSLTYFRLYLEDGTEEVTDVQVGDTIVLFERPQMVGGGSALGSIAGVTQTALGAFPRVTQFFNCANLQVATSGFLQISGGELLAFGTAPSGNSAVNVLANSTLVIGEYTTRNGVSNFSKTENIFSAGSGGFGWAMLSILGAGCRVDWFGGVCVSDNWIEVAASATLTMYSRAATYKAFLSAGSSPQLRQNSPTTRLLGGTFDRCQVISLQSNFTIRNLAMQQSDMDFGTSAFASPSATWLTVKGIAFNDSARTNLAFWGTKWIRAINNPRGSNHKSFGNSAAANASNRGLHEYRQEVIVRPTDPSGVDINGARVFCRDKNNGNRLAPNVIDVNPDYRPDRTYEGVSAAGVGVSFTTDGGVLLAAVRQNDANVAVDSVSGITWDYRGIDGTSSDRFTFGMAAYGYRPAAQIATLKGTTAALVSRAMLVDSNISQVNASIVSAYTSLNTLDAIYDSAALWVTQSGANMEFAGLGSLLINGSGSVLDLGNRNLVVDASAASAFAVNTTTNTITVKASVLAAGAKFTSLTTTGTVTFANGGSISTTYTDASGTRVQLRSDAGYPLTSYLTINGVPQAFVPLAATRNLTVQPADTIRLYLHAYGRKPRLIDTTGAALAQSATFALDPEVFVNTSLPTATRDTIAAAFDNGTDAEGRLWISVNTDLRGYSPEEVINALQYFLVTAAPGVAAGAVAAGGLDAFELIDGGFILRSPFFYGKVADSVTTVGDTGIYVPLNVVVEGEGVVPVRKNTSGIVLGTALWTKQAANITSQDASRMASEVWTAPNRTLNNALFV